MSQIPSAHHSSSHADSSADTPAEPGFEVIVHEFWNKNRGFILMMCGLVLVIIIGREGWQYFAAMREQSVQEDYARISDKPDRLGSFADANAGHPLAGVAYLQIADQKFETADFKGAVTYYSKAAASLKNEALIGRAKLGSAISLVSSGDNAGGEAALKALGADATLPKAVQAEATYHLASLAYDAGKLDDVAKLVEEVTKLDLGGPWSQRATMLLANLQKGASPVGGSMFKPESK